MQELNQKYSQASTASTASISNTSGSKISYARNVESTGLSVGNVVTKDYASKLGLSTNATIVSSGGTYYAKDGANYVDLTPIANLINGAKNISKYSGFTYGTK